MNIIQKMEDEALKFMHNRKKVEDKLVKEMLNISKNMQKEIEKSFLSQQNISISLMSYFISNEIRPIVERYRDEQELLMDSAIRDEYEVGIENGQRLLSLSNDDRVPPLDNEINNQYYEEVLIALLLYGKRLIYVLAEDTVNRLEKDTTSIYLNNKNIKNIYEPEKEIDSKNNSTINTIIKGSIIYKYIFPTFKNITNRADLIARNESNRALNHGHMMRYMRASDNIKGLMVKWVEVQDERLCKHCKEAAHGGDFGNGVYYIDSITPPPLHSRCRCILIPFDSIWEGIDY